MPLALRQGGLEAAVSSVLVVFSHDQRFEVEDNLMRAVIWEDKLGSMLWGKRAGRESGGGRDSS